MLNKAVVMGRLVANPELKQTTSGISVCSFTVAVNRNFKNKATGETQTDFIDIVTWRQTAEFVSKYFLKGNMIAVEGSIQVRSYEDSQGNKRKAFEIVADQVHFCGSKEQNSNNSVNVVNFEEPKQGSSFQIADFGEFEEISAEDTDLPF